MCERWLKSLLSGVYATEAPVAAAEKFNVSLQV